MAAPPGRNSTDDGSQEQRDADVSQNSATKATVDENQNQEQQLLMAGLHRDGEQARIVEVIRRRQQKCDEKYYTFEYFWESVLYYSGFAEEHPSSIQIQQLNDDTQIDNGGETKNLQTDSANKTTDEQKPKSTPQPTTDENEEQLREKAYAERNAKRPFIVRLTFTFYRRIHLMLRWFVDTCITRLSRLESLPRSRSMYAANPAYSLQFTADDILCFIVLLWMSVWISSRTSHVLSLAIIMICIVMGSVGTRVVGRIGSAVQQLETQPRNSTSSASAPVRIAPTVTPTISATDPKEESSESIKWLRKSHPNATEAECVRFYRCTKRNKKAASARLEEWFAWRLENGLKITLDEAAVHETIPYGHDYMNADEKLWNETTTMALKIISKSAGSNNGADGDVRLPQIICSYEMHFTPDDNKVSPLTATTTTPPRCKDGTRIIHLVPARFDLSIATAQVYALAAALYLDRLLSRSTTEKVSLICDVRGGRGWANPTPWSLLPFIQATSSLLGRHFPERLKRMVLYPMPSSAVWVWQAAKKLLDADTASKVVVVGDGLSSNNDNMHEELEKFITKKDYLLLEERRRSFFVPQNS
jgi:hypothetical protein